MKRSTERILTTHAGSLARPSRCSTPWAGEWPAVRRRAPRPPGEDAVADRVRRQVENGIDVVTDGEMSKVSFLGYVKDRLGGFEPDMETTRMAPSWQEVDDFPEYYASTSRSSSTVTLRRIICRGPISYVGPRVGADRHRQPAGGRRAIRRDGGVHPVHRPEWPGPTSTTPATRSTWGPWPRRCGRSTSRSSTPVSSSRSTIRS